MNPDLTALLSALNAAEVEYLVVGAYALAWYGQPRATGDLDVWVEASRANAERLLRALAQFGAPLEAVSVRDFETPGIVYQIGLAPVRVDILTELTGLAYAQARARRLPGAIGGVAVNFLGREDFIANKRAVGRLQDLADIERLQSRP